MEDSMSPRRYDSVVDEVQAKHEAFLTLELSNSSNVSENATSSSVSPCPSLSSGTSLSNDAPRNSASKATPRAATKAEAEFSRVQNACPVLRSTGCTEQFCQAGRMVRTNEPRVGQDRSLTTVQEEALDFLRQLRDDAVIETDVDLNERISEVLQQLQETSKTVAATSLLRKESKEDDTSGDAEPYLQAGGLWQQSREELEHGLRLAWKNASKCIMRSESYSLRLYDLRHITSSQEMGSALIENMKEAFNSGDIRPAVCVFPPRGVGQRGPMIWNGQLLSFAGYRNNDGTILGDPSNTALTNAIIELGWKAPQMRTQWDLLPLVTMAEDDEPCITEISEHDFPPVRIKHPTFELAFEKLGLRWVPAPALSQLGFDIGGVQYTATPFLGWFMDAEIGVRDLADQQRYNMLPKVVVALGWVESEAALDRAPEHEKLALLSKAQAELTYAVYHSYKGAGVMMSDTLTASSMYCNFDDQHFQEKGFRLPSNAYWLAPPQGSIVPLWHRGGAPNYQPTPLICKHVQNPINAWKREQRAQQAVLHNDVSQQSDASRADSESDTTNDSHDAIAPKGRELDDRPSISIYYCSAATTAKKLATELYRALTAAGVEQYRLETVKTLNGLDGWAMRKQDVALIVASTTGHGEVPSNGAKLVKSLAASSDDLDFGYMVFGNGSTIYHETFNAAAKQIHDVLVQRGATSLDSGVFEGDTAMNDPPWEHFEQWTARIRAQLGLDASRSDSTDATHEKTTQTSNFDIVGEMQMARLLGCSVNKQDGILHVVLDIGRLGYQTLSHVTVLLPNEKSDVRSALKALGLTGREQLAGCSDMTTQTFLTDFIDLQLPFTRMDWAEGLDLLESRKRLFASLPLKQALKAMSRVLKSAVPLKQFFAAMPLKTPRTYSTASSQALLQSVGRGGQLELLVQSRHRGLVSSFFRTAALGSYLRIRHHESKWETLLNDNPRPVICFATGSGLAPIRSLLQHRLHLVRTTDQEIGPITLILGFRTIDATTILGVIHEALRGVIVDVSLLTPSNHDKIRAQDRIFDDSVRGIIEKKLKSDGASVLVCASEEAAKSFEKNLQGLIGCDVRSALGERYVQEVFLHRNGGLGVEDNETSTRTTHFSSDVSKPLSHSIVTKHRQPDNGVEGDCASAQWKILPCAYIKPPAAARS